MNRCKNETNIPAKQNKKGKNTRFPETNVYQAGQTDYQKEKSQGPQAARGLIHPSGKRIRKTEKLLKRGEFLYLSRQGNSIGNHYFVVAFQCNALGFSRLGITVTRKTGNAVVRNRIKRLVREFFRKNRHLLGTGVDVNVIAKRAAADATSRQSFVALRQLFGKIGGQTN